MEEAKRFKKTREAHSTEIAEDYVEAILDLEEQEGEAKLTDISKKIGVSHPTVFKALRKLEAEGLVVLEPYKAVKLSKKGRDLARACQGRHQTVVEFLRALGLPDEIAEIDAEGMEHHVSPETLAAMTRFTAGSPGGK